MKATPEWQLVLLFAVFTALSLHAAGTTEKTKSTEISFWALSTRPGDDDPASQRNIQLISEFQELHPHVKINLKAFPNEEYKKQIQIAVRSGNPPDIFHSWGGYVMFEFAQLGALRNITYYVNSSLVPRISPEALNIYSYAGNYYGAPIDMGGVVLWYNREIFRKCGVDVPATWDELLDAVVKIKKAGFTPVALGAADRWPVHYWWVYLAMRTGGYEAFNSAYAGSGSFQDEPFIRAGERLRELVALEPFQEGYLDATYDDQARLMGDGEAAMELMGHWALTVAKATAKAGTAIEHIDIFPFPYLPDGKGKADDIMGGCNGYIIGKDAPDETLDFLDFMLSSHAQRRMAETRTLIPVIREMAEELQDHNAAIFRMMEKAGYYQLYYDQFFPYAAGEALNNASLSLISGKLTPIGMARMIDNAWQSSK